MADAKSRYILDANSDSYQKAVDDAAKSQNRLTQSQNKSAKSAAASTKSFDKLAAAFSRGRDRANQFAKVATGVGVALTAGIVKSGLSSVDALAKTSDKLGVTTEALAGLRFAAEQTGVAQNALDIGLQRFTRRLSDAAAGTGPAVAAFDALGLSAAELVELSPDEALGRVADKMRTVENQSQKVSLAFKFFDSEGVSLVNTLEGGSAGLEEFARQAATAGVAINRIDAAKVEQANDAINRVATGVKGFGQQLAVQFAPTLTGIADRLFGIGQESGGMAKAAEKAFNFIIKAVGVFADGLRGIHVIYKGLKAGTLAFASFVVKKFDLVARAAVNLANLIPGINIDYENSSFANFVNELNEDTEEAFNELHELAMQKIPSEALEEFVDESERAYNATAEAATNSQGIIQQEMIETADVTEALATKTTAATKEIESAWDKALQGTAERIDSDFSSAWRDALDGNVKSFQDFASDILDAAKGLFAELLHLNITRPIVTGIAGAFGLATGSSTAGASSGITAGSGFSGLGGNALGFLSGGFSGLAGGYAGVGNFLGRGSFLGDAFLEQAAIYNNASIPQALAYGGLNIGAGLAGGYLGDKVFGGGQYAGIGSTIGGFAGSAFGPLGTLAGSFIGSGIGSLFGGKNNGNQSAKGVLDFGSGDFDIAGVGKSADQANIDAVTQVTEQLKQFADALGGSNANLEVQIGNKFGFKLNGEGFGKDVDAFFEAAYKEIIRGAEHVDQKFRDMALTFEGTAEQTAVLLQSFIAMEELSELNPITDAIEAFTMVQPTVLEAYQDQVSALSDLVSGYDGTAESAAQLANSLAVNKAAAYEFAMAIQAIGASITETAEQQARSIRESVMTEEQLNQARLEELYLLRVALNDMVDPEEIQKASARILELNRMLYDALPEEQQLAQAEEFATFAERTAEVANERLAEVLGGLQKSQEEINKQIIDLIAANTETERQTAEINRAATNDFAYWVNRLITQGINVNAIVTNQGGREVNI